MPLFFDPTLKPALVDALGKQEKQLKRIADSLDGIETCANQTIPLLGKLVESQENLANTIDKICKKLFRPQSPGALSATIREVNDMFVADVTLPDWALADADVQFATIYCNIAGVETTHQVAKGEAAFTTPEGNEGDAVTLSMTYTDDANPPLESPKSPELNLVFSDTQPPAAPVALVATVREV